MVESSKKNMNDDIGSNLRPVFHEFLISPEKLRINR